MSATKILAEFRLIVLPPTNVGFLSSVFNSTILFAFLLPTLGTTSKKSQMHLALIDVQIKSGHTVHNKLSG